MSAHRTRFFIAWPVGLGLLALLILRIDSPAALAQAPWPTPPPASLGSPLQVIPASQVTPLPAPATPGGIVVQLDSIFAGYLPRIPPRSVTPIISGETDVEDRITLEFEAGATYRTLQLSYEPIPVGAVPPAVPGHAIQRAFRIAMFDHNNAPVAAEFACPVRLELHARHHEQQAVGNELARLLLARLDDHGTSWLPLVTVFDPKDGTVMARIVRPGLFALIAFPPPVPQ